MKCYHFILSKQLNNAIENKVIDMTTKNNINNKINASDFHIHKDSFLGVVSFVHLNAENM